MSSLEDRRDAFEKKYVHDEELRFRVEARTSRLFGLWAAQQMGLDGPAAETYAREVIGANLEEPGYDDIKRKVLKDFESKGVKSSGHMLDREIEKCHEEAKKQLSETG